jgi:hypothetical protein
MRRGYHLEGAVSRRGWRIQPLAVPLILFLGGAFGFGFTFTDIRLDHYRAALPLSGCNIKGNISIRTGERIYHVPGQEYYDATRISLRHGERWFCSEEEARQAGWRRSRV